MVTWVLSELYLFSCVTADQNVTTDITKLKVIIHNELKEIQKWLRLTLRFNPVTVTKSIHDFSSQPRLKSGIFQIWSQALSKEEVKNKEERKGRFTYNILVSHTLTVNYHHTADLPQYRWPKVKSHCWSRHGLGQQVLLMTLGLP